MGAAETVDLPAVRRFEAAGFRAWPAASVSYDGTWVIRVTPDHPSRRLNSVNVLDRRDVADLDRRITSAAARFRAQGVRPAFRLSPLSGPALEDRLATLGWKPLAETIVMRLPLAGAQVAAAEPVRSVGSDAFLAAAQSVAGWDDLRVAATAGLVSRIQADLGLFVGDEGGCPVASLICVRDGDLAGIFELATAPATRGRGHARRLLTSALSWAQRRGARQGWLQVEADNSAGCRLYGSLGWTAVYRYHYRQAAEG